MLLTLSTQKALKADLGTQKALQGNFKVTPRALQGHLSTPALEGPSGTPNTWVLKARGHLKDI